MITFNELLQREGIDPKTVKLARHQDARNPSGGTPYLLWENALPKYEQYQNTQRNPRFKDAKWVASFVGTPMGETLFVGLYENRGVGTAPAGLIDPISLEDIGGLHYYDLVLGKPLEEYQGKLVVDWGLGYRQWVHRAHKKNKPVIEIRRTIRPRLFPGYLELSERLSGIALVPQSWREALSAVSGVYLLTSPKTGKQYVGSAYGADGFWGRWSQYVQSGHGGNKLLQELPRDDYWVSILEVASSSATEDQVIQIESRWKDKLQTRAFGLNAN